jgi:hypothetical protein
LRDRLWLADATGPFPGVADAVSLIYKATGNLRAVQILLGHTNIENTIRYLGVDVDDALTLSERTEI